jgi:predicted peroxiredoxin
MATQPSLQILLVAGPAEAARALAGARLAAAAAACGTRVFLFLYQDGARWLQPGAAAAPDEAALTELLHAVAASGGVVEICSNCAGSHCSATRLPEGVGVSGLASVAVRAGDMTTVVF